MSAPAMPPQAIGDAVLAAKAFLRTGGDGEEALIGGLAASAFGIAEAFIGQALIVRSFEDKFAPGGGWQGLSAEPVIAIDAVTAVPIAGAPIVLGVEAYAIDIDGDGRGWVRVTAPDIERVAVSYTAGLAARWDALPTPIAQGIVMLTAHLYADREGDAPPMAVSALWRPFRRMALVTAAHRP